jgi:type III secretory pathway component EscV
MHINKLLQKLLFNRRSEPATFELHADTPAQSSDFDAELSKVVHRTEGGIFMRIDENRLMLDIMRRDYPEMLSSHPEIMGMLLSQDEFLLSLSRLVEPRKCKLQPRKDFPRKWPRLDLMV